MYTGATSICFGADASLRGEPWAGGDALWTAGELWTDPGVACTDDGGVARMIYTGAGGAGKGAHAGTGIGIDSACVWEGWYVGDAERRWWCRCARRRGWGGGDGWWRVGGGGGEGGGEGEKAG
jgi:hypothetical protein